MDQGVTLLSLIEEGGIQTMGKFCYLFMIGLFCMLTTSCMQPDAEETGKHQEGTVIMDEKTIQLFNEGKVRGIPFPLHQFPVKQVTERWGKPDEQLDHEDIQVYIYKKGGQKVSFTVDETNTVNYYQIIMNMSLEEVNQKLGSRYDIKPTTHRTLTYPMGRYELRVRRIPDDQVIMYLNDPIN
ncbi:hypothetical protein HMPREF9374_1095 [Desmospora sp. 8437]|nr:hypothetical protein HMPREF9374_1095 [Desmospora sp. 8437]